MKKFLALTLALILCLGIFAGCGGNGRSGTEGNYQELDEQGNIWFDEPLQFTIVRARTDTQQDWEYIIQLYKETCNVEINFVEKDQFGTWYNLAISNHDIPDVTYLNVNAYGNQYGREGAYVNIAEHLENMPNLMAALNANPVYKDMWMNSDGTMYHIPIFSVGGDINPFTWFYREDVFKELGLSWPDTREGLEDLLRTLKSKGYSTPLCLRSLDETLSLLCDMGIAFGAKGLYYNRYGTYAQFDAESGQFYQSAISNEMKDMVSWIKQMMDEGLINKGATNIKRADWFARFANDSAVIGFDKIDQISLIDEEGKRGNANFSLIAAAPIAMNASAPKAYVDSSTSIYSFVLAKSADRQKDILSFIDWMYSKNGMLLSNWGKEGVDYTLDANGNPQWTEAALANGNPQIKKGLAYAGLHTQLDFNAFYSYQPDNIKEAFAIVKPYQTEQTYYLTITEMFNKEEREYMTRYGVSYQMKVNGALRDFILGNKKISEWDSFVQQATNDWKGADIVRKTNEAYNRVYGNK